MRIRDKEIEKVNKSSIKRLEKKLDEIDKYEESLIEDFNRSLAAIFDKHLLTILEYLKNTPDLDKIKTRKIIVDGKEYIIPYNILQYFHKSYIDDIEIKKIYEERLKMWFSDKTEQLKMSLQDVNSYKELMRISIPSYALASLALSSFHKRPRMILRDVQKMAGITMGEGDIAELSAGEGKTLSAILPVFLQAIRGRGVHVITSNGYLSKRDFEETLPIYEGLGLSSGYVPDNEEELASLEGKDYERLTTKDKYILHKKLKKIKQEAYRKDISFGTKDTFAFDYLRDNLIRKKEDLIQREDKPGFALIDEIDDALIDDAEVPYRIAISTPTYKYNMSLKELCILQQLNYDEILPKVSEIVVDTDKLTYEEAKYISNIYGKYDLLADPSTYQEAAENFFKLQKIYITENNKFGFKTSRELYDALLDEDMYDAKVIREKYGIIFCKEIKEFKISDKCFEAFLKFCYFSFQINSLIIGNKNKILNDKNYKLKEDYYITPSGKLKLTTIGANKILNDNNYPDFIDDYNKYLSMVSKESAIASHYFRQAVVAHLLMKNGEDYIVDDGKVKTLKNGRIQEGSTYSDGIHQAIELKENIAKEFRTKETTASSTITQKEFYERYDLFTGMTGTSSKKVFGEIFGKGTVEIPKNAFYSYYGNRKKLGAKEPLGVEKRNTTFSLNIEDKIKLIVNSIIESQNSNPKQPVLLVVSNFDEIKLLEDILKSKNISFNTLTATTPKEEEALIIAEAGCPGSITISTEMAGRGTDIKIGGDRDTIIDIATERHIRLLEKKSNSSLNFSTLEKELLRNKVEKALEGKIWSKTEEEHNRNSLDDIGLKVISSGYFETTRVDRQLEGRTGRNGISGVCERFACIEDLKRLGINSSNGIDSINTVLSKFNKDQNGKLLIDDNTFNEIIDKIAVVQKNHENEIKERIKQSQKLNSYATKMIEEYRDKRRKIICGELDTKPLIDEIIEEAVNAIISSYILEQDLKEKNIRKPLNNGGIKIDIDAVSLEIKQTLGVTFDPNIVEKSNINLMELRDALIRTAKERRKGLGQDENNEVLLLHNDYMLANIPEILECSFNVRNLVSMSMGMENQAEALANIEFSEVKKRMIYESYKYALKCVMGLPLTNKEFKDLEKAKAKLFDLSVEKDEKSNGFNIKEAQYKESNTSVINKLKTIRQRLEKEDQETIEEFKEKAKKNDKTEITKLYRNLSVRPLILVSKMINGNRVTQVVLVKDEIEKQLKNVKGLH